MVNVKCDEIENKIREIVSIFDEISTNAARAPRKARSYGIGVT